MGRTLFTLCLTLSVAILLATGARAQVLFSDDFGDGNDDGWARLDSYFGQPWGPGIYDASSGAYHLHSSRPVPVSHPFFGFIESEWEGSENNSDFRNGVMHGTVRADTSGTTCGY